MIGAVRFVAWLFRLTLVVTVAGLGLAAVMVGIIPQTVEILHAHAETAVELPPFTDLAKRSYLYDAKGNQLAYFQLENSQPTSIDQIPDAVIQAFLAVEDDQFFQHHGVNLRSFTRAVLSNVQGQSSRQGASTITQQVVKLEYLAGMERDARYKLLQARYAVLLERELSKGQIIERYLNTVFFGNNAYGIQAAAEVYFGKQVKDLDLIEGAFLAGLVRAPSSYEPIQHAETSRARFRTVMTRLAEEGLIEESEATRLAGEWPLPARLQRLSTTTNVRTHFTEAVKQYLLQGSTILGDSEQERYNALFRGGLQIYTTIDPGLQALAEDARTNELPMPNALGVDTALVSLDSKTGAVRAMVGGAPFVAGSNEVNLALRARQTGSSIKMFILAAAIQAGAQPNDVIDGVLPCKLPNPGQPDEPFEITSGSSKAAAPLEQMTWSSINCAFARLSQIVGLNRLVDELRNLGIQSPLKPYASFATGANEVTPMDMASAAQTLANDGLHHDPYYVERIDGPDGDVVYQHYDLGTQVLTRDAALTTTSILKGVVLRGTARRSGFLEEGRQPAAGKTGTQDSNTNAWFVGYTPLYTTAVWVGDPSGYSPMTSRTVPEFRDGLAKLGKSTVQGATFPLSIWRAYMEPAHVFEPDEDWDAPPPNPRAAMRLYLPGEECLAQKSQAPTPAPDSSAVEGQAPESTAPPAGAVKVTSGTTIPPDVVDPTAPLPTVDLRYLVYNCEKGLPKPPPPPTTTTVPATSGPPQTGTTTAPAPTTTAATTTTGG
ncbi:MAG: transglycosylase domain-containing protein [Ilumatobacteraceae bacterium]